MKRAIVFYPGTVAVVVEDLLETPQTGTKMYRGGCMWIVHDVIYNTDEKLIKILLTPSANEK